MWWEIARRELLDHLTSLRFVLVLGLSVLLMALNGVLTAGGRYQGRANAFQADREQTRKVLKERATDLAELGIRGPEELHKEPSPLALCAAARDEYLPASVEAGIGTTFGDDAWGMWVYEPWLVKYNTPVTPPRSGIVAEFQEVDWGFTMGLVLSLMAILLTFDGICGDRQAGTLQLVLSGAVPRAAVIGGKYAAALLVLLLALGLGVLVNLTILAILGTVALTTAALLKMGAMVLAGALYLAFFDGLGLLVSARCERPSTSLVSLLLIWTVLVFLLPNTAAGLVSSLAPGKGPTEAELVAAKEENWVKHGIRGQYHSERDGRPPRDYVKKFADFTADWLDTDRRFFEGFHAHNLAPVELGRRLGRLTPYGVLQSAMESLADTGLPRHLRFLQAARQYEQTFRNFIQAQDATDPDSYHLMGVTAGMSHRPVSPETIPVFHEDLSARASITDALPDLLLLILFAVAAFLGAHLAFLRGRVA